MNKKNAYFRCIKGVVSFFDKSREDGNVLSFKNEIWKIIEPLDNGFVMECVEGYSFGWEITFSLEHMAENFEWIKDYEETTVKK